MATLAQCDLGVIYPVATAADIALAPAVANGPTSRHQLVDQLLTELRGNVRIGRAPAAVVNDDESGRRRLVGGHQGQRDELGRFRAQDANVNRLLPEALGKSV